jgi:outer membrane protein OmpA-like peptidoglycan-associated protein
MANPKRWLFIGLLSVALVATSCAGLFSGRTQTEAYPLETAARRLAGELLENLPRATLVVLDPFADKDSAEVPLVSLRIEEIMLDEAGKRFSAIELERLTSENAGRADFLVSGTLKIDSASADRTTVFTISASVKDLRTDSILARSVIRVSDPNPEYAFMAIYRENPFFSPAYMKDRIGADAPRNQPGLLDEGYSLQTLGLLREASGAYEKKKYAEALALFTRASQRGDGQTLWTYSGLYLSNLKLGRTAEADSAFGEIIRISVEKHNMLTVRFLFRVNSVEFWQDDSLNERYDAWLRHIGTYFQKTGRCLHIVGHCSRTGPEEFNQDLSLRRAKKIQSMLKQSLPDAMERTAALGKGSMENIVGIGTDDERDALDRRVELIIVDCK